MIYSEKLLGLPSDRHLLLALEASPGHTLAAAAETVSMTDTSLPLPFSQVGAGSFLGASISRTP